MQATPEEGAWLADVLNQEQRSFGTRSELRDDGRLELHWITNSEEPEP